MSSSHQRPPPFPYNIRGGGGGPSPNTISTPNSASTIYASPEPLSTQPRVVVVPKTEPGDESSSGRSSINKDTASPVRKKQRRNKPTLSCQECVERKTKGDYAVSHQWPQDDEAAKEEVADKWDKDCDSKYRRQRASNVFGIGSEHPFANYWTCEGGLPEVISVLPDKLQADMLLGQYFECVDPVYPMIDRHTFFAEYENFWSLHKSAKDRYDAAFVALIFVMLALGTQFVSTSTNPRDRKQTAEFYASASNQALRMCSYLSTASINSVRAMVLLVYFLINDNHASDGWAFAGILMRQALAMGLHRDPNIVAPGATLFEKQQRRKLWQAVLLQDTFLTVLLSLPPSATHTDVNVDDFSDEASSIVNFDPTDTAYVRGSWTLANLVQETICSPRSLDMPICTTQRQKSKLVADFRAVYRSFPDIFRSGDQDTIARLVVQNKRVARQTLFLTSNYYHNLMLVHASESADVPVNVRGTLEAAHEAITAFFLLYTHFQSEARVWWVFNHRAFLEALCVGSVLREAAPDPTTDQAARDPLFARARSDINRMIQIMRTMGEGNQGSEVARTRVAVLSEFLSSLAV
ncbi:hypothetical protein DL762_002245 [Monosporascus cannonballus]|uniref:Xylanolytic transcriptional activator regulatory domain-containing protein n=1 Tax=Monosporascus cannonballus TaxID=155416 RepID=A0ABY0HGZ4_9PEZI|nr:hypothetical protein DL762_002245 [Monosporascus cannonballus]